MRRERVNTDNWLSQMEQADRWYFEQSTLNLEYQREFPDKITIIQGDDITLTDPKHYQDWMKAKNGG